MNERPFDVVVFGATGFAGKLTAEYLQRTYGGEVRWAVAGRSEAKLKALVADLAAQRPDAPAVPYVVADSADRASLDAMAASTQVVCTTVGPYAKYGAELVAACVAHGTHYGDLTGEPQFIRRMVDAHHEGAKASGSRIVHCCGFDSVPSDLGAFLVQQTAIAQHGGPCDEVEYVLMRAKGGVSGGTLASMVNVMDEAGDPKVRKVLADPYGLCTTRGPDTREQMGVRYSEAAGAWTGPFVMAAINERVVRRSNELLEHRYGVDFLYGESMRTGRGAKGWLKASTMATATVVGTLSLAVGPIRRVAAKWMTAPGDGPSDEAIASGYFDARVFGKRDGKPIVEVKVHGDRDPGYGATACMLAEACLGLAAGEGLGAPGVTTPAAALGQTLIDRLYPRLVQFSVV